MDAIAASLFDHVLARLAETGDDPLAAATVLSELAEELSSLPADRLAGDAADAPSIEGMRRR